MVSLKIIDIKQFMKGFLLEQVWDNFFLIEGSVSTYADFSVNGRRNKDWFDTEDEAGESSYIYWNEARPTVCQWIRGNKTPLAFQFTLALDRNRMKDDRLFQDVEQLYVHLRFENNSLYCVTGTAYRTFIMDRSAEREWDRLTALFLKKNGIAFER